MFSKQESAGKVSYQLRWQNTDYLLSVENGLLKSTDQHFPRYLLPELQLVMEASENAEFNVREAFQRSKKFSVPVNQEQLAIKLAKLCFAQANQSCLSQIINLPVERLAAAWVLLYQGHLSQDVPTRLSLYRQAHYLAPEDLELRFELQSIGLVIAEAILTHHEKLLNKHGIWKKLGTEEPEEQKKGAESYWYKYKKLVVKFNPTTALLPDSYQEAFLQWGDKVETAFGEILLNTSHTLARLFTSYEDDLLLVWGQQLEQTGKLKMAVKILMRDMQEGHLSLEEVLEKKENDQSRLMGILNSFDRSPFAQALHRGEILVNDEADLPGPDLLGVDTEIDFVSWDWGTFLVSQVNVLNVYMIFRGEVLIEALAATRPAQFIAATRVGQLVGAKLGIAAIRAKIQNWPEAARKAFIWFMTDQVLDGCLLRYMYIGYSAVVGESAHGDVKIPGGH